MRSYLTLLAAAAVFLAFIGLAPDDFRRASRSVEPDAGAVREAEGQGSVVDPDADSPPTPMDVAEAALTPLLAEVREQSHPDALRSALRAYYSYKAAHPEAVRKPYFYYVDFGLSSRVPRGYVFDMESLSVVEGPFTVSHGRGSVRGGSDIPTVFSNRRGSNATSLGLYLAQETYGFSGRSGGRSYRSVGLRLKGLSGSYNGAARERGIVVHGAPYVTARAAGRSEGCPAMEQHRAQRLIPMIANGGMVFHFSPVDRQWMAGDPWAQMTAEMLAAGGDRSPRGG
jgi:hypothetical protein